MTPEQLVLFAVECRWNTLYGIAKQSGLSQKEVSKLLAKLVKSGQVTHNSRGWFKK